MLLNIFFSGLVDVISEQAFIMSYGTAELCKVSYSLSKLNNTVFSLFYYKCKESL